jgi:hypothetical protein
MNSALIAPESRSWSQALERLPHDVYHLPTYSCLAAQIERARPSAFLYRHDGYSMLLPLLLRPIPRELAPDGPPQIDAMSPYGYPGPIVNVEPGPERDAFIHEATRALSATLRDYGVVSCFVRSHPLLSPDGASFDHDGLVVTHGRTVSIDLTESESDVWSQVRHLHRRTINKARRKGLVASIDHEWEHLDTFIGIYQETMNRLGATRQYFFPRGYFERLRDDLGSQHSLCVVSFEGRVIAAGLYSHVNGIIQYLLAGSTLEGLDLGAVKFMIHFMQGWGREHGATRLHLGGGLGGNEDALFWFKSGFSHRYHPFWTWRSIPNPEIYEQLAAGSVLVTPGNRTATTLDLTGYFPQYREP